MKKRRFHISGQYYDIPETEVQSFLSDNPHAEEVKNYNVSGKEYNIPVAESDAFENDMGLKKKESVPLPFSNGVSQSQKSDEGLVDVKGEAAQFEKDNPNHSEFDSYDIPTLAKHADELSKKTVEKTNFEINPKTGAKMPIASDFVPDEEAINTSKKIDDYLKKKGLDRKEVNQLFGDFPKEAYDVTDENGNKNQTSEKLLEDYKNDPIGATSKINNIKTQFDIRTGAYQRAIDNGASEDEAHNYAEQNGNYFQSLKSASASYPEFYDKVDAQKKIIGDNLTGEQRDKALQRLEQNSSHFINATQPQFLEEYKGSQFKDLLNPNEYAGLKTLELFHPEEYQQAVDFITKPIKNIYEHHIDPKNLQGFQSPVAVNPSVYDMSDSTKRNGDASVNLSQKTVNEQIGLETIKRKLANIGRANAHVNLNYQFSRTNNPDEQNHLKSIDEQLDNDEVNDVRRYPLTEQMKFDQFVKDKTNQEPGLINYGAMRFAKQVGNIQETFENLFGNNTALQRQRLGESQDWSNMLYLPKNISENKNLFSKSTLYQMSGFLGDVAGIAYGSAGMPQISKAVNAMAPMFLTSQADYYKEAVEKGISNPNEYANIHAGVLSLAALLGNRYDYVKKVVGAESKIAPLLNEVDEKTWNNIIAENGSKLNRFKNAFGDAMKENVKQAAIWGGGMSLAQEGTNKLFYNDKTSFGDMLDHAYQATKDMLIGQVIPTAIHTITGYRNIPETQKAVLWELGDNKDIQLQRIDENVKDGTITKQQGDQRKKVVKDVADLIEQVPTMNANGKPLTDEQRSQYLYNSFIKSRANDLKKSMPEAQKEKLEGVQAQVDAANNEILQGKKRKIEIAPDDSRMFTFENENEIPKELSGTKPITKSEIETKNGKKLQVRYSGQQLIDAGLAKNINEKPVTPEPISDEVTAQNPPANTTGAVDETAPNFGVVKRPSVLINEQAADRWVEGNIQNETGENIIKRLNDLEELINNDKRISDYDKKLSLDAIKRAKETAPNSENDLLEPFKNNVAFAGMKSNDEKFKMVAEQAQNIMADGTLSNLSTPEKSYDAAVRSFGKELVDKAIEKFPSKDLLKNQDEIKVNEVIDKPVIYNGKPATLYQDGQTVVAKLTGENKEYELGNINEVGDHPISDYGIEHETSIVKINNEGNIEVRGKEYVNNYSDPKAAINYDKDGNIVSVNLETADGQKRAFKGNVAEDIAYQIHLKEINKNNETKSDFENFINTDEPTAAKINDAGLSETATQKPIGGNEKVPREKAKPKPVVPLEKTENKNQEGEPPKQESDNVAGNEGEGQTGIKNKISKQVRIGLQLPKIELPKMGADIERIAEGKRAVDEGEIDPQEVVNRVIEGKGKISMQPKEAAAMQYYMHQLGRATDLVNEQLSLDLPHEEKIKLLEQQQQLSDLLDNATQANMLAGTAWSDVGHTRQILIDQSFNISREKAFIKEAFGGEVPKEFQMKVDAVVKERDAAIQQLKKVEEALRQREAELQAAKMRKEKGTSTKSGNEKDFKGEREKLIDDLKKAKEEHEKWLRDKGIQGQGIGFTLTTKMVSIIGRIAKTYVDEGVQKLSELIDKIHDEVKGFLTGIDKNDIRDAIALYESQKLNTKADNTEAKVAIGEIPSTTPKLKPKFQLNQEWVKANQRVINAEYKMKVLKRQAFESQKNLYQKGLMWIGRLVRLSVLSGYNVLAKLAAAATIGGAGKRIPEQAIGAMWGKLFSGIASKAPIEGGANVNAEIKFYKEFLNPKKFAQNAWSILKSGESKLSKKFGSGGYEHIPVLYLPTDLHQIIKDPLKRGTFEASLKNSMNWAERNGLDINDPLVRSSLETEAFKRANYEIFQEDNALSRAFKNWKNKMEKSGNVGATGKFIADFLIPVSTVPTNIARRLVTTSPLGLLRGSKMVMDAYRKGIENLNPQEADIVMKQLKQGTLGTALWMIGWFGASSFGGLYSQFDPNKKRKQGDLVSDEMEVDGKKIPKPVQHALPLEIIQWSATMRRIYDNYVDNKHENVINSIAAAGLGSIGALAEQIPVVETPVRIMGAISDPYQAKKLKEDMERRVEPQILRETGAIPKEEPKKKSSNTYQEVR
jgi:hypothetical protein